MYLRFALLCVLDLVANLVGYLLLDWWLPLLARADGNLPTWLRWFQTYDATLDGAGAGGGIEPRFVSATSWLRDAAGVPRNRLCRFLCRVAWLYRNNAYGFAYSVLGAPGPFSIVDVSAQLWAPYANAEPADRYPAQSGKRFELYRGANGRLYFHFWYVKDRGNGKCYEANVGWKISADAERAQIVWRWTPFRAFETQPVT